MVISAFAIIAVLISGIVILVTLAKITRQLESMTVLLVIIERKISEDHLSAQKIQEGIDWIEKNIKPSKEDVDWKG